MAKVKSKMKLASRQKRMRLLHNAVWKSTSYRKRIKEGAISRKRAFLKEVENYVQKTGDTAGGEALKGVDPNLASGSLSEMAALITSELLKNSLFNEHFIDIEILDEKLYLYFYEGVSQSLSLLEKLLVNFGEAEIIARPKDNLFVGAASNYLMVAIEPTRRALESVSKLVKSNQSQISEDNVKDQSLTECQTLGLDPVYFSDSALEACEATAQDIADIHEDIFGAASLAKFEGEDAVIARNDMIRSLGYVQALIPEDRAPSTASDLDLEIANFNKAFFENLRKEYKMTEDESIDLDEAELSELFEEYVEEFARNFDLDDKTLIEMAFGHVVDPREENLRARKAEFIAAFDEAVVIEMKEMPEIYEEGNLELEEAWKKIKPKKGKSGELWKKAIVASKNSSPKKKALRARQMMRLRQANSARRGGADESVLEENIMEAGAAGIRKGMLRAMATKGYVSNGFYNTSPASGGGKAKSGTYPGLRKWAKFTKQTRLKKSKQLKTARKSLPPIKGKK